jgi:antitoxin ParD1/3/4
MCHTDYIEGMATNRTTVNISLTPELEAFLQSRVRSGRYLSSSEVVREALRLLEQREQEREAALLELKAKLKRGAAQARRGDLLDGDKVFDELRELIKERRRPKAAKP